MPFLVLRDPATGISTQFDASELRVGRSDETDVVLTGDEAGVASMLHAQFAWLGTGWSLTDLGSTAGTLIDDRPIPPSRPVPIEAGMIVTFGANGPRRVVVQVERRTRPQQQEITAAVLPIKILVKDLRHDQRYEALGLPIRVGRAPECELRPVGPEDVMVSRLHAEIIYDTSKLIVIREASSTNGTFLNGQRVRGEAPIHVGDRILLGPSGPDLVVENLHPADRRHFPR